MLIIDDMCCFIEGVCPSVAPALEPFLNGDLTAAMSVKDPSLPVLTLLRILHAFNRFWCTMYEVNRTMCCENL